MIHSSQHLDHELWVQEHTVAGFSPQLLLLPREATNAQPVARTQWDTQGSQSQNKRKLQDKTFIIFFLILCQLRKYVRSQMRQRTNKGKINDCWRNNDETQQTLGKGSRSLTPLQSEVWSDQTAESSRSEHCSTYNGDLTVERLSRLSFHSTMCLLRLHILNCPHP